MMKDAQALLSGIDAMREPQRAKIQNLLPSGVSAIFFHIYIIIIPIINLWMNTTVVHCNILELGRA